MEQSEQQWEVESTASQVEHWEPEVLLPAYTGMQGSSSWAQFLPLGSQKGWGSGRCSQLEQSGWAIGSGCAGLNSLHRR